MLPFQKTVSGYSSRIASILSMLPDERSSTIVTSWPFRKRPSQRCDPMNPAPPVTTYLMAGSPGSHSFQRSSPSLLFGIRSTQFRGSSHHVPLIPGPYFFRSVVHRRFLHLPFPSGISVYHRHRLQVTAVSSSLAIYSHSRYRRRATWLPCPGSFYRPFLRHQQRVIHHLSFSRFQSSSRRSMSSSPT